MKPLHILYIPLALVAVPLSAIAQPWSLDSCINYAIEHNITVTQRDLDRSSAQLTVTEAKDRFLPQLEAGANQSFNFGRGLTSENTYANRNTSQLGWNVGLSLPIFQGLSAKRQLDYSRANLLAVVQQYESAKDDITLNVISQYLQVLYTAEIHAVAQEQVRLSQVELQRRKILLEGGKIPELDLIQAESQLAQDELTAVTTANDHTLALLDLSQLLQLPSADGFDIAPLHDDNTPLLSADDVFDNASRHNHGLKAAELTVQAEQKSISVAKSGYLPRLSFNAGIGSSYYKISGMDNAPFHRQMRDNFNKSLGFSLSIPIFDAFSTRNSVRRAKIRKLQAELQLDDTRTRLYKDIQQAHTRAVSAEKKRQSSIVAREATKKALDAMQEKYNFGRANATEFEQAKTAYIKASSEAVQAKYESILRNRILLFYNQTH